MYSLCVPPSLFAPLRTRSESAADSTKKQIRNCILLILNSRHSNLPIPLSLYVHANMLYPLSLFLLPHQICLRLLCALRSRLLIYRSLKAGKKATKKQIQFRICFCVCVYYKISFFKSFSRVCRTISISTNRNLYYRLSSESIP